MLIIKRDQFLIEYGNVEVQFVCYYKFVFTYKGTTQDGKTIMVSFGGGADSIYERDVSAEEVIEVKHLEPDFGYYFERSKTGERINVVSFC